MVSTFSKSSQDWAKTLSIHVHFCGFSQHYYTILYYTILYYTILYYTIVYYTIIIVSYILYTILQYHFVFLLGVTKEDVFFLYVLRACFFFYPIYRIQCKSVLGFAAIEAYQSAALFVLDTDCFGRAHRERAQVSFPAAQQLV